MVVSADTSMLPWVEKYRPKRLSDFAGNVEEVKKIESWLVTWKSQRKKALWISGPAGVGKTSVIHYLTNKYNIETIELNASDKRNKKAIETIVGRASQEGSITQGSVAGKLILVDEADGLFGNADRGGARALAKAIEKTRVPIICTANDPDAATLKSARKYMVVVTFNRLTLEQILTLLKRIVKKEGISVPLEVLVDIAKNSAGDARSAINDLESYVANASGTPIEFSSRDQEIQLSSALHKIFSTHNIKDSLSYLDSVDADYRELLAYLYEHAYSQAENATELERFYHLISLADFYLSKCYITQDWRYLKYFFTFLAGIGTYKHSKVKERRYGFPSYWALIGRFRGKNAKIKQLAQKCSRKLHCGEKEFTKDIYPYLRMIFNTNPQMAAGIAVWLQFTEEDIEFLVEGTKRKLKVIMQLHEEAYRAMADQMMKESSKKLSIIEELIKEKEKDKEKEKETTKISKPEPLKSKKSQKEVKKEAEKTVKKRTANAKEKTKKKQKRVQKSLDEFLS